MEETNDELPTRWEIELEFVQSLCNVQYLSYLAQNEYLSNPEFLNYLQYLNYWKQPQYAKYLVYPNCLHILTLLQNEEFRKGILDVNVINMVSNDMYDRWTKGPVTEKNGIDANGGSDGSGTGAGTNSVPVINTQNSGAGADAASGVSTGVRDMDIDTDPVPVNGTNGAI